MYLRYTRTLPRLHENGNGFVDMGFPATPHVLRQDLVCSSWDFWGLGTFWLLPHQLFRIRQSGGTSFWRSETFTAPQQTCVIINPLIQTVTRAFPGV